MCKLRYNKVQAARDIFYMHTLLEAENSSLILGQNKIKEMITVPRNRRAMQASEIVMFMQQVRFPARNEENQYDFFNADPRSVLWCERYCLLLIRNLSRGEPF